MSQIITASLSLPQVEGGGGGRETDGGWVGGGGGDASDMLVNKHLTILAGFSPLLLKIATSINSAAKVVCVNLRVSNLGRSIYCLGMAIVVAITR